jgi:hypothetical protein
MKSKFTIFYVWQSDTPKDRGWIKRALDSATKRIRKDPEIQDIPFVQEATRDAPGFPVIATTILDRIGRSGMMVADVTLGSEIVTVKKGKLRSVNQNVLFELGYGFRSLGPDRIVCVMNTDYGQPDELPFDLRHHRWPLLFSGSKRERLSADIETAIRQRIDCDLLAAEDVIARCDDLCLAFMKHRATEHSFTRVSPCIPRCSQNPPPSSESGTSEIGFGYEPSGTLKDGEYCPEYPLAFKAMTSHFEHTVARLLDLGVLWCDSTPPQPSAPLYIYSWTHLGKSVLRKLGFRTNERAATEEAKRMVAAIQNAGAGLSDAVEVTVPIGHPVP